MGTRQLRLPPTESALLPVAGRPAQVVLMDGEVLHGQVQSLTAETLRLQTSPRFPAREILLATIHEVIADLEANH